MFWVDGSMPYPKEQPVLRPMPNRFGAESNPLARSLYLSAGPLGPALLKAAAISIMLLALVRVVRRFPTYALPSAVLLVGIGLFGAASNLLFGLLR
jgi:hypothetical protein